MHHSQQDPKNRVSKREIKVSTSRYSQETRFLTQVQDLSRASTETSSPTPLQRQVLQVGKPAQRTGSPYPPTPLVPVIF
ncbi:hypothetical protein DP117_22305 [Brasilonema sp. UFV-L1]|nr:hypothetical protein [Brasilonema sp. UFV-L1]